MFCCTFAASLRPKQFSTCQATQLRFKLFQDLEDAFSLIVFLLFSFILSNLFKKIFVLAYMLRNGESPIAYSYTVDFLSIFALTIAIVFSADSVQQRMNQIRRTNSIRRNSDAFAILESLSLKAAEEHGNLALTGFGMFTLRRSLVLSLIAWLFTFGAIIIQYFYTPSVEKKQSFFLNCTMSDTLRQPNRFHCQSIE
ncbi:uncharacterized protein CDAR_421961 [Caerostris darwini]|uniref:Gustatory receptor n=1 Tax=Caerostris darwini TaxID=1538125 RepID=A0AAV4VD05_9ARAC|nr:uncharacterized protein CDAR_421961 [Caerostris darwini]